jgi:hypothetical protein
MINGACEWNSRVARLTITKIRPDIAVAQAECDHAQSTAVR